MKTLYYPVFIAPGRKQGGWSWGKPCDTRREAAELMLEELRAGASLGAVVEFSGGEKKPLLGTIRPERARKIIGLWDDLWEATK